MELPDNPFFRLNERDRAAIALAETNIEASRAVPVVTTVALLQMLRDVLSSHESHAALSAYRGAEIQRLERDAGRLRSELEQLRSDSAALRSAADTATAEVARVYSILSERTEIPVDTRQYWRAAVAQAIATTTPEQRPWLEAFEHSLGEIDRLTIALHLADGLLAQLEQRIAELEAPPVTSPSSPEGPAESGAPPVTSPSSPEGPADSGAPAVTSPSSPAELGGEPAPEAPPLSPAFNADDVPPDFRGLG